MKNLTVFAVFFVASFAVGAAPILIGVGIVYAVACFMARHAAQPAPPAAAPHRPAPTYGGGGRKIHL
jgi:hypothetical protein